MILDLARELSAKLEERGINAAVIGGIAVLLHGHVRTTTDIELFVSEDRDRLVELLAVMGFLFDASKREFVRDGIPVHLVSLEHAGHPPRETIEIDGVRTVSLRDLIEMKLRSGSHNLLRAQDLGDAVALIRKHDLDGTFARHLDKTLRLDYRRIVRALAREREE
jgi:hypothetical protein